FLALGGPHAVTHTWDGFKSPKANVRVVTGDVQSHLSVLSGEGRYQFWTAALHAFTSHPLGGIGAGTFQFWWAAHGSIYAAVINAHSLYMETLAETGLPGILLLAVLLLGGLAAMVSRWRGAPSRERALLAAILGGCAAFLVSAAFDWVWQIPALPAVLLLLIAAGTGNILKRPGKAKSFSPTTRMRAVWTALALVGALVIIVPMVSAVSVRESQAQASAQRLAPALKDARTASSWQPYAATPLLQQALVMERAGNFSAAAVKARKAARAASTDWSTWLVLSRIEAEHGDARGAVAAYRHARSLDPRDPIFKSK
ncbi:MAG: O-antigen ligase family protein, partial [Solirubrobacteraceae bacterium]